jgi:hypothetical protein
LTGVDRESVRRIECGDFIPSIQQFDALSQQLDFHMAVLNIDVHEQDWFSALRNEELTDKEREGVDKLFTMILSLRQSPSSGGRSNEKQTHPLNNPGRSHPLDYSNLLPW